MNTTSFEVNSLGEYVSCCRSFSAGDRVIYRGQSLDAPLLPGVARAEPTKDNTASEMESLRQLRLAGPMYSIPHGARDLEVLAFAQHYGLRTRLLDWSWNPLVALWFALDGAIRKGSNLAYVYMLKRAPEVEAMQPDLKLFDIEQVWIIDSPLNNSRIHWQAGCFTLHPYSRRQHLYLSVQQDSLCASNLATCHLEKSDFTEVLESLDCVGVNSKSIYPDEHGLMQYLNSHVFSLV